jgi:hypothetical protein
LWRSQQRNLLLDLAGFAKREVNRRGQWQALSQISVAILEKHADDDAEPLSMLNRPANPSEPPEKHAF